MIATAVQPIARTPSTLSASPRAHLMTFPLGLPGPPPGAARPRGAGLLGGPRRPAPRPRGRPARPPRDDDDRPHRRAQPPPGAPAAPAADGCRASVGVDDGTQMVALDLGRRRRAADGELRIRSRGIDGTWTAWEELEADEAPRRGPGRRLGRAGQRPAGRRSDLARNRRAPTRSTSGSTAGSFARPLDAGDALDRSGRAGGVGRPGRNRAGPGIIGRDAWAPGGWRGDNPGCPDQPTYADRLRFAVVHHTVNANDYSQSQVAGHPRRHLPVPHRRSSAGATSPTTSSSTASVARGRAAAATSACRSSAATRRASTPAAWASRSSGSTSRVPRRRRPARPGPRSPRSTSCWRGSSASTA